MIEILLEGEHLCLLPERALWWPSQKTMILSDLHWGKSAHFRKHGIPMPGGVQEKDGLKLAKIVTDHGAERLMIAGDFFHSHQNKEVDDFGKWRKAHESLHIDFILGNHDILPPELYTNWQLTVHATGLDAGPFHIAHDEVAHEKLFTIHGHIHPGMRLHGLGRQAFTLPCFCIKEHCMVLPAFGQFTGCKTVQASDYRQVYVVGDGKVVQWK